MENKLNLSDPNILLNVHSVVFTRLQIFQPFSGLPNTVIEIMPARKILQNWFESTTLFIDWIVFRNGFCLIKTRGGLKWGHTNDSLAMSNVSSFSKCSCHRKSCKDLRIKCFLISESFYKDESREGCYCDYSKELLWIPWN